MGRGWERKVRDWLLVAMGGIALVLLGFATYWVYVGATNSTVMVRKLPDYERRLDELEKLVKDPDGLLLRLNENIQTFNEQAETFDRTILHNPVVKLLIGNPVKEKTKKTNGR